MNSWDADGDRPTLPERYHHLRRIGGGAQGVVWLARDQELGGEVVIKVRRRGTGTDPSLQREVAALLALDRPCVSRLLDLGEARDGLGRPVVYLVMSYVSGSPFPERGRAPWAVVRRALVDLLRALRHVHAEGIVHRDLKPEHVLLTGDAAVLLDLGASTGPGADARGPHPLGGAGTWSTMAPEQIVDAETVGSTADLYAVGVMAYEALTGRPPHDLEDLRGARLADERVPIAQLRPDLPAEAARLVEALLARMPEDRPQSADEALALLGEAADAELAQELRHWAGRAPTDADLLEHFYGPERIFGRASRAVALLHRRAGRAEELGAELSAWMAAGRVRWEEGFWALEEHDLRWLDGDTPLRQPPPLSATAPALPEELERLHALIHLGWPGLSRQTLGRLTGASEVEVDRRISALGAAGRVLWTEREALARAATLPRGWGALGEAAVRALHAELAAALPEGSASRQRHLVAAGEPEEAVRDAILAAEALYARGLADDASTHLDRGLQIARMARDRAQEARLLELRVVTGLATSTEASSARAAYELARSALDEGRLAPLRALVQGVRDARRGRALEAIAAVEGLPAFADERLDRWRVGVAVEAGLSTSTAAVEAALGRARQWAEARDTKSARADVAGWEGAVLYREARTEAAVDALALAARDKPHGSGRVSSWGTLAAALLDLGRLEEAEESATGLLAEALRLRLPVHAAVAEWVLRSAAWRRGLCLEVDWPLVRAARALGRDVRGAQILFTEAAFAWRRSERAAAQGLATEAASVWRGRGAGSAVMAECLALINASEIDPGALEALARRAAAELTGPYPGLALQGLAALLIGAPTLHPHWREVARARWHSLAPTLQRGVRELVDLSVALEIDVRGSQIEPTGHE